MMSKPQGVVTAGSAPAKACLRTGRHPALRWPELAERRLSGTWEPGTPMRTEKPQVEEPQGESTEAEPRDGTTRSSEEVLDKGMERRGCVMEPKFNEPTRNGRSR